MTARNTLPMDPKLLAIMTGELGNNTRIGKTCASNVAWPRPYDLWMSRASSASCVMAVSKPFV